MFQIDRLNVDLLLTIIVYLFVQRIVSYYKLPYLLFQSFYFFLPSTENLYSHGKQPSNTLIASHALEKLKKLQINLIQIDFSIQKTHFISKQICFPVFSHIISFLICIALNQFWSNAHGCLFPSKSYSWSVLLVVFTLVLTIKNEVQFIHLIGLSSFEARLGLCFGWALIISSIYFLNRQYDLTGYNINETLIQLSRHIDSMLLYYSRYKSTVSNDFIIAMLKLLISFLFGLMCSGAVVFLYSYAETFSNILMDRTHLNRAIVKDKNATVKLKLLFLMDLILPLIVGLLTSTSFWDIYFNETGLVMTTICSSDRWLCDLLTTQEMKEYLKLCIQSFFIGLWAFSRISCLGVHIQATLNRTVDQVYKMYLLLSINDKEGVNAVSTNTARAAAEETLRRQLETAAERIVPTALHGVSCVVVLLVSLSLLQTFAPQPGAVDLCCPLLRSALSCWVREPLVLADRLQQAAEINSYNSTTALATLAHEPPLFFFDSAIQTFLFGSGMGRVEPSRELIGLTHKLSLVPQLLVPRHTALQLLRTALSCYSFMWFFCFLSMLFTHAIGRPWVNYVYWYLEQKFKRQTESAETAGKEKVA